MFTDIHFGRRQSSKIHNQDCLDYIAWFCKNVKQDKSISHVAFLGDWFESRTAINIETLEYSYEGMKLLGALNLPTMFVVGNHDLHRRNTREVFSTRIFNEIPNVTVIDKITVVDDCVFSPFLFESEYADLLKHNDKKAFFGHFEFKNFVITGYNTVMEHGPDHKLFDGPKKIFSGHFHKRQVTDNVVYIGNCFNMDYGDINDIDRGMATYDLSKDKVEFKNWENTPTFTKVSLSKVLDDKWSPIAKLNVKCIIDTPMEYSELQDIKTGLVESYSLRSFVYEDDNTDKTFLIEGDIENTIAEDMKFGSIDELIINRLEAASEDKALSGKYDIKMLIDLYKDLKIESTDKDNS